MKHFMNQVSSKKNCMMCLDQNLIIYIYFLQQFSFKIYFFRLIGRVMFEKKVLTHFEIQRVMLKMLYIKQPLLTIEQPIKLPPFIRLNKEKLILK